MYCTKNTFCKNCADRSDCLKIGSIEIENRNAEKALADIYKTFCIFCFVLIIACILGV